MKNMRGGFTMIELIFVIVIIGILASVAIPKLAATRDDAKITKIIADSRTVLSDMQAYRMAQGNSVWTDTNTTIDKVTNVTLSSSGDCTNRSTAQVANGYFVLCDAEIATAIDCVGFWADPSGTQMAVLTQAFTGSEICNAVATSPALVAIAGPTRGTPKFYTLGGSSIAR